MSNAMRSHVTRIVAGWIVACHWAVASAQMEGPPSNLVILPAQVSLAASESTSVLVVVRNSSNAPLRAQQLTVLPSPGVRAKVTLGEALSIGPGSAASWQVEISREATGPLGDRVQFALYYETTGIGQPPQVIAGIATGELQITSRSAARGAGGAATAGPFELELLPSQLTLATHESATVLVVVRNTSDSPLTAPALTANASQGIRAVIAPANTTLVEPGASAMWEATVTRDAAGSLAGRVQFALRYAIASGSDPAKSTAGIALAELPITARPHERTENVVTLTASSSTATLQQFRPGRLYLKLENKSDFPVQVADINSRSPDFVTVTAAAAVQQVAIPEQSAKTFEFTATAGDAIQPGKHSVVFDVDVTWDEHGTLRAARLVASHDFEVGILGESELMKAVGIPTFLLLPGALLMITFGTLLKWSYTSPKFPTDPKEPAFWALAVVLSAFAAPLYAYWTHRDYLQAYGLRDIVIVWTAAVVIGAVVWVLVLAVHWICRVLAAMRLASTTPSATDLPIPLLRKLSRNRLGLERRQVTVQVGGGTVQLLVVSPDVPGQQSIWVVPPIAVKVLDATDTALLDRYQRQKNQPDDVDGMVSVLKSGLRKGTFHVYWQNIGGITNPTYVALSTTTSVARDRLLVEDAP